MWHPRGRYLIALVGLAIFGLGSRAVLGFLSPGAYAEEVVAARTFLTDSGSQGGSRTQQGGSRTAPTDIGDLAASSAVANLPWLTTCQGNAIANRARFYTSHAHTPMLLLAGVPVVYAGGPKALYLVLLAASLVSIGIMAWVLIERSGLHWTSPAALLVLAAVAGWQPVLAGVRQGDAVLPAAGLVALAWYLIGRHGTDRRASVPAAVAACLAVPAIGVLPALWRTAPRAAAVATGVFLVIVGVTVATAGSGVVPGFIQTVGETARTYADAPANYAIAGRALKIAGLPVVAVAFALVLICSWWRGATVDAAFASFAVAGLMVAPVLWSQHLALLLIPFAVLFVHTLHGGSSLALAALAALALVFSLPDTIAIRLAHISSPITLIGISAALIAVWGWTTFSVHTA